MTYYRGFDLHSAGGKVTFTGKFVNAAGEDASIGKTGPGEIVIENAGSVLPLAGGYDWTGGTLTVAGAVTIPDGAPLTVDASLCTKENEDTVFVLLRAGSITGRFTLATELPDGWGIKYTNGKVVLRHGKGFALLIR